MAGKRILLARAEVNMIAADDVYTADDQLLIPADTVLTEDVIAALKEHSVFAIHIKVDEKDKKHRFFMNRMILRMLSRKQQHRIQKQHRIGILIRQKRTKAERRSSFHRKSRIIRKNKRKKIIMKQFVNLLSLRHFMRNF